MDRRRGGSAEHVVPHRGNGSRSQDPSLPIDQPLDRQRALRFRRRRRERIVHSPRRSSRQRNHHLQRARRSRRPPGAGAGAGKRRRVHSRAPAQARFGGPSRSEGRESAPCRSSEAAYTNGENCDRGRAARPGNRHSACSNDRSPRLSESSKRTDAHRHREVARGTPCEPPLPWRCSMIHPQTRKGGNPLARFATLATVWTGSTPAFMAAVSVILIWLATGPIFHYSDTWQLVINTGTTIVTFLMVFLIQRAQNKEASAMQMKLNEIVAALEGASNRLISVEDLSEHELGVLHIHFQRLAEMARSESNIAESHSVEEAEARHAFKRDRRKRKSA